MKTKQAQQFHYTLNAGTTRYHRAAFHGYVDMLCDANKRHTNAADEFGLTPVHLAALSGHVDALRILVGRGGDPEKRCASNGSTALHLAASRDHLACVSFLVNFGANVWALDDELHSAKDIAMLEQAAESLNYLDQVISRQSAVNTKLVQKLKQKARVSFEKRQKQVKKAQLKAIKAAEKDEKYLLKLSSSRQLLKSAHSISDIQLVGREFCASLSACRASSSRDAAQSDELKTVGILRKPHPATTAAAASSLTGSTLATSIASSFSFAQLKSPGAASLFSPSAAKSVTGSGKLAKHNSHQTQPKYSDLIGVATCGSLVCRSPTATKESSHNKMPAACDNKHLVTTTSTSSSSSSSMSMSMSTNSSLASSTTITSDYDSNQSKNSTSTNKWREFGGGVSRKLRMRRLVLASLGTGSHSNNNKSTNCQQQTQTKTKISNATQQTQNNLVQTNKLLDKQTKTQTTITRAQSEPNFEVAMYRQVRSSSILSSVSSSSSSSSSSLSEDDANNIDDCNTTKHDDTHSDATDRSKLPHVDRTVDLVCGRKVNVDPNNNATDAQEASSNSHFDKQSNRPISSAKLSPKQASIAQAKHSAAIKCNNSTTSSCISTAVSNNNSLTAGNCSQQAQKPKVYFSNSDELIQHQASVGKLPLKPSLIKRLNTQQLQPLERLMQRHIKATNSPPHPSPSSSLSITSDSKRDSTSSSPLACPDLGKQASKNNHVPSKQEVPQASCFGTQASKHHYQADVGQQAVESFLAANNLSELSEMFAQERIDLEALLLLSDDDFRSIGILLGPRRKLLKAVDEYKRRQKLRSYTTSSHSALLSSVRQTSDLIATDLSHASNMPQSSLVVSALQQARQALMVDTKL